MFKQIFYKIFSFFYGKINGVISKENDRYNIKKIFIDENFNTFTLQRKLFT